MDEQFHVQNTKALIEISSDEDSGEDAPGEKDCLSKLKVTVVFDEFLNKCRLFNVTEETTAYAREMFHQASSDFVTQNGFIILLEQYLKLIDKKNVKDLITSIGRCLYNETLVSAEEDNQAKPREDSGKLSSPLVDMPITRNYENNVLTGYPEKGSAHQNTQVDDDDIIVLDVNYPSICTPDIKNSPKLNSLANGIQEKSTSVQLNKKHSSAKEKRKKRKEVIRDLRKRLNFYSKEIKKLQESELSLEEMDQPDSSYLKECQLKKLYVNVHKKLCKLEGCTDPLENRIKNYISIVGSPYPEINREAAIFVNNQGRKSFPDFFDIKAVVRKANNQYNIGLKANEEEDCAREIFSEIGDKLQRKRKKEFTKYSGSFLTDPAFLGEDPAADDKELKKKLKKNRKISQHNTDKVFRRFLHIQYQGCASASSDDDEFTKEVLETQKKISPNENKRKHPKLIPDVDSYGGYSGKRSQKELVANLNITMDASRTSTGVMEEKPTESKVTKKLFTANANPLLVADIPPQLVSGIRKHLETKRLPIAQTDTTLMNILASRDRNLKIFSKQKQEKDNKTLPSSCKRKKEFCSMNEPTSETSTHARDAPSDNKHFNDGGINIMKENGIPVSYDNCHSRHDESVISVIVIDSDEDLSN